MRGLRAKLVAFALFVFVCSLHALPAFALAVPPLRAHVNDLASLLSEERKAALEQKLTAHEQATGQQFALLTVPSLEGDPIEDFSIRVAEQWKLGHKGKDDGLIMIVAPQDHKMRIEVGYGLEGDIQDVFASAVIREVLAPAFRSGDFAGGIDRAFDLLIARAGGQPVDMPVRARRPRDDLSGIMPFIVLGVLLLIFLSRFGGGGGPRGRRGVRGYYGGGYIGGGGFGGGFGGGGGGGGGWGGGGGGGFGGGGSSGDW